MNIDYRQLFIKKQKENMNTEIYIPTYYFNVCKKITTPYNFLKALSLTLRNPNKKEINYIIDQTKDEWRELLCCSTEVWNRFHKYYKENGCLTAKLIHNIGKNNMNAFFQYAALRRMMNYSLTENKDYDHTLFNGKISLTLIKKYITAYASNLIILDINDYSLLASIVMEWYDLENASLDTINYETNQFLENMISFFDLYLCPYTEDEYHHIKVQRLQYEQRYIAGALVEDSKNNKFLTYKRRFLKFFQKENIIDQMIKNDKENLDVLIYMIETFALGKEKKQVLISNYITIFELLITHRPNEYSDRSITNQLKNNISACLAVENKITSKSQLYDIRSELNIIYKYRSDISHGDFKEAKKTLLKLEYLPFYHSRIISYSKLELLEFYSKTSFMQILLLEHLQQMFRILLKLYIKNPTFITSLKL